MPQPAPSADASMEKMREIIEATQRSLTESETFFEQFGLNGDKVRTYLESISTPEMRAQAQAAIDEDMRAVEQEVRDQFALANAPAASTRTFLRKPRNMI